MHSRSLTNSHVHYLHSFCFSCCNLALHGRHLGASRALVFQAALTRDWTLALASRWTSLKFSDIPPLFWTLLSSRSQLSKQGLETNVLTYFQRRTSARTPCNTVLLDNLARSLRTFHCPTPNTDYRRFALLGTLFAYVTVVYFTNVLRTYYR